MTFQIGMRIPPKLGSLGMENVALGPKVLALDVIDVPYYNEEIKEYFGRIRVWKSAPSME